MVDAWNTIHHNMPQPSSVNQYPSIFGSVVQNPDPIRPTAVTPNITDQTGDRQRTLVEIDRLYRRMREVVTQSGASTDSDSDLSPTEGPNDPHEKGKGQGKGNTKGKTKAKATGTHMKDALATLNTSPVDKPVKYTRDAYETLISSSTMTE